MGAVAPICSNLYCLMKDQVSKVDVAFKCDASWFAAAPLWGNNLRLRDFFQKMLRPMREIRKLA